MAYFTFIVPVYNAAATLDRCVKSITNQDFHDIEIILVDDGSTDISGHMCDLWAKTDARIQVIHKENQGPGMARNSGMAVSTGRYIGFVDSDDRLLPGMVQRLRISTERNEEVVFFGYLRMSMQEKVLLEIAPIAEFLQGEAVKSLICRMAGKLASGYDLEYSFSSACMAIYSHDLIDREAIQFTSERETLSEDILFNIQISKIAHSIRCLDEVLYCYYLTEGSLTSSYRADRFEKAKHLYYMMDKLVPEDAPNRWERMGNSLLNNALLSAKLSYLYAPTACIEIKNMCQDEMLKRVFSNYPLHKEPLFRRVFFFFIKQRLWRMVYVLLVIRYGSQKANSEVGRC